MTQVSTTIKLFRVVKELNKPVKEKVIEKVKSNSVSNNKETFHTNLSMIPSGLAPANSIAALINSTHEDLRNLILSEKVRSYKATADGVDIGFNNLIVRVIPLRADFSPGTRLVKIGNKETRIFFTRDKFIKNNFEYHIFAKTKKGYKLIDKIIS